MNQSFDASAGFHLSKAGTDRNVVLAEQICTFEKERIRARNQPEIAKLGRTSLAFRSPEAGSCT